MDSNAVLRAEILWVLHTISCHNSNEGISKVFSAMFPDSEIARGFSCGGEKTAYLTVFGLAEYFKRSLLDSIKGDYCVLFDESLNNMVKEKQMDIHGR